jgi:hypothetical protein
MFSKTKMLVALNCLFLFALQISAQQAISTSTTVTTAANPALTLTVTSTVPATSTLATNTGIGSTLTRVNPSNAANGSSLVGVQAETTFDVNQTGEKGSANGQLATSAGWMSGGSFVGVSGESKPVKITSSFAGSTAVGLGGNFVLNAQNLNLGSTTGNYLIAGSASTLQGTIANYAPNSIYSAVVGRDQINNATNTWAGYFEGRSYFSGRIGIGKKDPQVDLHIQSVAPSIWISRASTGSLQLAVADCNTCFSSFAEAGDAVIRPLGNKRLILSTASSLNSGREVVFASNDQRIMSVRDNRKVTIGTENMPTVLGTNNLANYKLFVGGGILTDEVTVQTGWADYVFAPEYRLTPLNEVEAYIAEKGHLPNTPSASEIEEGGLNIGNAMVLQQEKIEEIYLHLIALEKELNILKAENEALKTKR